MSVTVEIDASEAIDKLDAISRNIAESESVIELVVAAGVNAIVDEAKILCPVATGNLRDSIHAEGSYPEYYIIADAVNPQGDYYAMYVEMGSSKQIAQPFIWPAIYDVTPVIRWEIASKVREFILGGVYGI